MRILNQQLVIPDFHGFTNDLTALYHFVEGDHSGANADYIPILRCALCGTVCCQRSAYQTGKRCTTPLLRRLPGSSDPALAQTYDQDAAPDPPLWRLVMYSECPFA